MLTSILWAVVGGALIGLAASWMLWTKGRIAGISGILGGLVGPWNDQSSWRVSFLIGLLVGGDSGRHHAGDHCRPRRSKPYLGGRGRWVGWLRNTSG